MWCGFDFSISLTERERTKVRVLVQRAILGAIQDSGPLQLFYF
jgi:hypothetical protein